MPSILLRTLFAPLAALLLALPPAAVAQNIAQNAAQNTEVAGIQFEQAVRVGGERVQLNGAGVRYKAIFKVYAAGLYLSTKVSTPEEAILAPGPKRIHVVMLRDVDANDMGRLFTRGIQDNTTREDFMKVIPGTAKMGEIFGSAKKRLVTGDQFMLDYVPGNGTTLTLNGKSMNAPIPEPEFFTALLKIWLGRSPADHQLKDLLLGKVAPQRQPGVDS